MMLAVMAFSPPYYPRTDRATPNAHDDAKRGRVVGFRDSYPAAGLPGTPPRKAPPPPPQ